jgi:hypothetical protein
VLNAHRRRVELEQIYLAMDGDRMDEAVALCRQRFEAAACSGATPPGWASS